MATGYSAFGIVTVVSVSVAATTFPNQILHDGTHMGLLQSDAVVLQTYPLSETDRIVVLYSRGHGKLRGVARGARKIKSSFSGRLEPFHWIEFSGYERENQELIRIDKAELIRSFGMRLPTYQAFLRLSVLAELLLKTVPDREPNDSLFRLLLEVLPELRDPVRSNLAQLYFEIWHLRLAGLLPASGYCAQCHADLAVSPVVFFGPLSHSFFCAGCKQGSCYLVSSLSYRLLRTVLRNPISAVLSSEAWAVRSCQNELSLVIEDLLRRHFERNLECLQLVHSES